MGHSYICNRLHVVFSTQERLKQIDKSIQPRLWATWPALLAIMTFPFMR